MPIFTQPIHEHGDPDRPGPYPHGAGRVARKLSDAQIIRPGQPFDLAAAARDGVPGGIRRLSRRFLFNPSSREFMLGGAMGVVGRDHSHAEALSNAEAAEGRDPKGQGQRYDQFRVHGHIQSAPIINGIVQGMPDAFVVAIDRIVSPNTDVNADAPDVEASDALAKLARRLSSMGATRNTKLFIGSYRLRDLLGAPDGQVTLGKAFPDIFPRVERRRAA